MLKQWTRRSTGSQAEYPFEAYLILIVVRKDSLTSPLGSTDTRRPSRLKQEPLMKKYPFFKTHFQAHPFRNGNFLRKL